MDIKNTILICPLYTPSLSYVGYGKHNCISCEYQEGTKCQDIHKAVDASERTHDAYSYMIVTNRGIFM